MTETSTLPVPEKKLGKLPAKSSPKALLLSSFIKPETEAPEPPVSFDYWKRRAAFPARTFSNDRFGCCTRASQAVMATRFERIETRRTALITDEEVLRVYFDMTDRRYGGGDTGAYETDALDDWRREETAFRDTHDRPLVIDAYARVNHLNITEVKRAIVLSEKQGLKVCLNLPAAFMRIDPPAVWDVPDGQALIDDWMPGSAGGHSLTADAYSKDGIRVPQQWYTSEPYHQLITWRAFAAYCDESHIVIDSYDAWRRRVSKPGDAMDLEGLADAVNAVSSKKIKVP